MMYFSHPLSAGGVHVAVRRGRCEGEPELLVMKTGCAQRQDCALVL